MSLKTRQSPVIADSAAVPVKQVPFPPPAAKETANSLLLQAQALRRAAKIAESAASPLASRFWNEACQRIQQLIEAEAAKLESNAAADN